MKKEEKAQKAMEYLAMALNLLPQEGDFESARIDIRKVLKKLEESLKKRIKSKDIEQTPLKSWNDKMSQWAANSSDPKKSLNLLDKMLEDEKKKLLNMQLSREKQETLLD